MTRTTRPLLALLAVAFAAIVLAACGGGGTSGGDTSGGGPSGGGSGSASAESGDADKALAFQECLRSRGVDVEVDERGGMMMRTRMPGESGPSANDTREAMDGCRESSGWSPPEPSGEERAEMRERALAFARCMREQGVDVPDPSGDGQMTLRMEAGNRQAFERAARECGDGGPSAGATFPATPSP